MERDVRDPIINGLPKSVLALIKVVHTDRIEED
jgi:hypothetical protein